MKFSEKFGIANDDTTEWFDVNLKYDTPLFVDPLLVFRRCQVYSEFAMASTAITDHFDVVFKDVAEYLTTRRSDKRKDAIDSLIFPEAKEYRFGYTLDGSDGSGSSEGVADKFFQGIARAISVGVNDPKHFEKVSIFIDRIGPDRVSDACLSILKQMSVNYTQRLSNELGVKIQKVMISNYEFDLGEREWLPETVELPTDDDGKPIVLVPKAFLRQLPNINHRDFIKYATHRHGSAGKLGRVILSNLNKEDIINIASANPDMVREYLSYRQENPYEPYDFKRDRQYFDSWEPIGRSIAEEKLTRAASYPDVLSAVVGLCESYKSFVELNEGAELLRDTDGTPRPEKAAQLLFMGIAKEWLKLADVDVSKEVNIGRGPVDFKISRGASQRVLLEMKLAKNSKLIKGNSLQLTEYLKAEGISIGIYLVIYFNDNEKILIENVVPDIEEFNKQFDGTRKLIIVDARGGLKSASKL